RGRLGGAPVRGGDAVRRLRRSRGRRGLRGDVRGGARARADPAGAPAVDDRRSVHPVFTRFARAHGFRPVPQPPRPLERQLLPRRVGRLNGMDYYVIAAILTVRDALELGWPGGDLLRALAWALCASTAISMLDRLQTWLRGPLQSRSS